MFLSIVIPVYNAEKYIAECLESCINQDISYDDYEIVCVNDGSTDSSISILQAYSTQYDFIKVISQPNSGVSSARNVGIENAKGDYIWFVDADDVIASNCLLGLRDKCIETDCDRLGFCLIPVAEKIPSQEELKKVTASDAIEKRTYEWGYVCLTLMRREFLESHHIRFHPQIAYGEDMVFNYTWDLYTYKLEKYNKVLYYYRCNPASAMQMLEKSREAYTKRLRSIMHILLWLRENGMEYKGQGVLQPELALRYSNMLHMLILGLLPDVTHKEAKELWRDVKEYDLLSKECLYTEDKEGKLEINPTALRMIRCKYVINRLRYCLRHPIQWLFG